MKTRSAIILCVALIVTAALSVLTFCGFTSGKYIYMPLIEAATRDFELAGGTSVTVSAANAPDPAKALDVIAARFKAVYPSALCSRIGDDMMRITDGRTGLSSYYENLASDPFHIEMRDSDGNTVLTRDEIESGSVTVGQYNQTMYYTGMTLTKEGREAYAAHRADKGSNLTVDLDGQTVPTYYWFYDEDTGFLQAIVSTVSANDSYQSAANLALYLTVGELEGGAEVVYGGSAKVFAGDRALAPAQMWGLIALAAICVLLIASFRLNGLAAALSLYLTGVLALTVAVLMQLTISASSLIGLYAALLTVLVELGAVLLAVRREKTNGRTGAGAVDAGFLSARPLVADVTAVTALGAMLIMYFGNAHAVAFGQTFLFGTVIGAVAVIFLTRLIARSLARLASAEKA